MKLEGEYAADKTQRAHRIASGIFYAVWIGLSFHTRGLGQAFKTAAYYLLPMSCIWFSDAMASYTGVVWGRGRSIDEPSNPAFIRWGGWFLLSVVPIMLLVMFALSQ